MFKIDLIPLPYKILIGLAILAGVYTLAYWQGGNHADKSWQLKDTQRIAAESKATLAAVALKQKQDREQASRVAALDAKYIKDLSDAQTQIDSLRRAVRTGSVRLYAKSTKPTAVTGSDSAAASGTHAATVCELDPTTADDLISITSDGDAAIQQLNALQSYVLTILEGDK